MKDIQKISEDAIRSLSKAASENPLSAALVGAGILWMMAGASRPAIGPISRLATGVGTAAAGSLGAARHAVTDGFSVARETIGSAATDAQDRIQDGVRSMGGVFSGAQGELSERAGHLYDSADQMTGSAKDSLIQFFERQPLALAAVGLAIGAGIAASIPSSELEKELMGEASADVTSSVTSLVLERTANIKEAVLNEAETQGLTPDKAKDAIQSGVETVKSMVGSGAGSGVP